MTSTYVIHGITYHRAFPSSLFTHSQSMSFPSLDLSFSNSSSSVYKYLNLYKVSSVQFRSELHSQHTLSHWLRVLCMLNKNQSKHQRWKVTRNKIGTMAILTTQYRSNNIKFQKKAPGIIVEKHQYRSSKNCI